MDVTTQFYSLDLSTSWPTSAVPWKALPPGRQYYLLNAVGTADNQTFIEFIPNPTDISIYSYNLQTSAWTFLATTPPDVLFSGFRAVTDPRSGLIYVAGPTKMNVLDQTTYTWTSSAIAPYVLSQRYYGGAVFNSARKSIMYHGGYGSEWDTQAYITEYQIDTKAWSNYTTTGQYPTVRSDHCMAASEDGTRVVVFGGRVPLTSTTKVISESTFSSEFYVLDVVSGVWRQGPNATSPRVYMACLIAGDQFLVWGGSDNNQVLSGGPIIFDLTKFQWTNAYTAPSYYPKPSTATPTASRGPAQPTGDPKGGNGPSNTGAIVGGVVGGLAVVGLAGGLLFFYRRKKRINRAEYDSLTHRESASTGNKGANGVNKSGLAAFAAGASVARTGSSGSESQMTSGHCAESIGMEHQQLYDYSQYQQYSPHQQPYPYQQQLSYEQSLQYQQQQEDEHLQQKVYYPSPPRNPQIPPVSKGGTPRNPQESGVVARGPQETLNTSQGSQEGYHE
ncbi:hypothetical protein EDD11_005025 [Mortierella claussenii]|nr:hypothetical protein EDD11_005025 [Mortierella claussenii]